MPYHIGNDEQTGYNMYDDPKSFKKQGYPGLADSEDRHIWPILVCATH